MISFFTKINNYFHKFTLNNRGYFVIIVLISLTIAKVVNMIGNKILTIYFPADTLADYLMLFRTASFLSGLAMLNFGVALLRLGSEYNAKAKKESERNLLLTSLVTVNFTFLIIILLLEALLPFGFMLFPAEDYQLALFFVLLMGISNLMGSVINVFSKVKKDFKVFFLIVGLSTVFFVLLSIILIFFTDLGIYALIYSNIVSFGMIRFLGFFIIVKKDGIGKFSIKELKSSFKLSSPGLLVTYLLLIVDFVFPLLIYVQNEADLAIYSYSAAIANFLLIIGQLIQSTYIPEVYRLFDLNKLEKLNEIINKSVKLVFVFGIALIFVIIGLSTELILLFYTKEYLSGELIVIILSFSNLLLFLNYFSNNGMLMKKRADLRSLVSFIGIFTKLICGLILINLFGIYGLAVSELLRISMVLIFGFFFSQKCYKVDLKKKELIYILLSALMWIIVSYGLYNFTNLHSTIIWILPLPLFFIIIYLLKVVTFEDLKFLFKTITKTKDENLVISTDENDLKEN